MPTKGRVGGSLEGWPMLLLTMTGAKTGRTLVRPLCYSRDGDRIVVPIQNLNPDVLMVEPAEDWYCCDAAELLRPPKIRSVFIQ